MNRSNPTLLEFMQYHIDNCPTERGETYELAKMLGQQLIENCKEVLDVAPAYKDVSVPTGPHTTIDARGNLEYAEVPRPSIRKLEHYVREMADGGKISEYGNRTKVQNDLSRIYKLIKQQHKLSKASQLQIKALYGDVIRSLAMNEGQIMPKENGNAKKNPVRSIKTGKVETIPFLHLKRKDDHGWEYSKKLTGLYLDGLEQAAKSGITFQGKNALMTGAGAGSIGADVLQGLISGGAKVVVTTSRFSREVTEYYQPCTLATVPVALSSLSSPSTRVASRMLRLSWNTSTIPRRVSDGIWITLFHLLLSQRMDEKSTASTPSLSSPTVSC